MSAWALAGDPETQARPGSLSLRVAEVRRFVGSYFNPPLGESGEVRWEDSGAVRPWRGRRTQVRGRGGLLLCLCSGICGRHSAARGLCPWAVGLDLCHPLFPQSPVPLSTVGLQAAVTPVGFLQPGPQLMQLGHCLPGPLSQSHLPGGEPACSLWDSPLFGCSPPLSPRWFLSVLQENGV